MRLLQYSHCLSLGDTTKDNKKRIIIIVYILEESAILIQNKSTILQAVLRKNTQKHENWTQNILIYLAYSGKIQMKASNSNHCTKKYYISLDDKLF